jgi:hypothetical protein
MIFACARGNNIELRAAQSAAHLGQPGSWQSVEFPISFVNKIGMAALDRGEAIRFVPGDSGHATLAKLCGSHDDKGAKTR